MKKAEWLVIFVFILLGIICLTISATWILPEAHRHLSLTFITICLYTLIPVFLVSCVYMIFKIYTKKAKHIK